MSSADSPRPIKIRSHGWTPERQLRFLDALACTRNVSKAAVLAGMSREGAYRLRARSDGLFALLWDRAMQPGPAVSGHTKRLTDGQLARALGNNYRRKSGDFAAIRSDSRERCVK